MAEGSGATYNTIEEIAVTLDNAIEEAMTSGGIDDAAKMALKIKIREKVYKYAQSPLYHRRGDDGGLMDTKLMVSNYDRESRELSIQTHAMGTFKHSEDRLDELVETGTGFDYGGNAVIPRPFYDDADQYASSGVVHTLMDDTLQGYLDKI